MGEHQALPDTASVLMVVSKTKTGPENEDQKAEDVRKRRPPTNSNNKNNKKNSVSSRNRHGLEIDINKDSRFIIWNINQIIQY